MFGEEMWDLESEFKPVHTEVETAPFEFWGKLQNRVLVPILVMLDLIWSIMPWSSKAAFSIHPVFNLNYK